MVNVRLLIYILLNLACLPPLAGDAWDREYWESLRWKNYECGPHTLYTFGQVRYSAELGEFNFYQISACYAYQAAPWLGLEAHYSYIYSRPLWDLNFRRSNRLELEANPSYTFADGVRLRTRNRLEIIKHENVAPLRFVARQLTGVVVPIEGCAPLTSVSIENEVFYNFEVSKFTQDRFTPLKLSFDLGCSKVLNAYLMLRTLYGIGPARWYRAVVFGTELQF